MPDHPQPGRNFAVKAAIFEGGLALVALVVGALLGVDPMRTLHSDWTAIAWGAAAAVPPLMLLAAAIYVSLSPVRRLTDLVEHLLVPPLRQSTLAELAIISLLAGLGEEMLFRGAIQAALADRIEPPYGPWLALAVASLLFGLAHFITFTYAVFATLMGAYLGLIWMESGNLLVPIVAHAVYDFTALVYLVKLRPVPTRAAPRDETANHDSLQDAIGSNRSGDDESPSLRADDRPPDEQPRETASEQRADHDDST